MWEIRGFGSYNNHEVWIGNSFGWFWFDNPLQDIQKFLIFLWDMIWFVDFIYVPDTSSYHIDAKVSNASDAPTNAARTPLDSDNEKKTRGKIRGMWFQVFYGSTAERFQVAKFMKRLLWIMIVNWKKCYIKKLAVKSKVKLWRLWRLFFHASNEDLRWTYVT